MVRRCLGYSLRIESAITPSVNILSPLVFSRYVPATPGAGHVVEAEGGPVEICTKSSNGDMALCFHNGIKEI